MLEISTFHQSSTLIVHMKGRIDASSAKDLEQQVLQHIQAGETQLILDFSEVDYISSAGLRVVLLIAKQLNGKGGSFKLCKMNEIILNVFEISGFSQLFSIFNTLEDAIAGS